MHFYLCSTRLYVILSFMHYLFIIGRNKELSIAELESSLHGVRFLKNAEAVLYKGSLPSSPQEFLDKLGGTMEVIEIIEDGIAMNRIEASIIDYLKKICSGLAGKCNFGLNLIPGRKKSSTLKFLLPRIKKTLRALGIKANFMNKDFQNVSAVFAKKQGLAESGTNISIIDEGEGKFALGFSVALQNIDAYSKRDYGKPFRDANVGMLPPKLAQIMVNLAAAEQGGNPASGQSAKTIFDPFCGTGTLLMEAMLMGFSVVGCDSDARMVAGAQKNIEWLMKNFPAAAGATHKVFQKNAAAITPQEVGAKLFSIATEPHLGPPLSDFPAQAFLEKLMEELGSLYLAFFKNLAAWVSARTPVVFIFPFWKNKNERTLLSEKIVGKIEALGFKKNLSLFYDRPDQVVGREIVGFVADSGKFN